MIDYDKYLKWQDDICNFYSLGKQIYDSMCGMLKESAGTEMIVSPANLGDTVFIATLAKAYKKAHGIKTLLIVAKERQAAAVEWFEGVDGVVGIGDYEIMCLRYYFTISRNFYSNGIRYGHIPCYIDWNFPGTFFHLPPGFSGISLMDVWKERILDLPKEVDLSKLIVPSNSGVASETSKYKDVVLIAPAAFTNKGIPESFWAKLASKIKERGLEVYCNSGGLHYDKIIEGTTECLLSTKELIVNAPNFRHVVAVRSGFTDLVTKTSARMSVLHLGGTVDMPLRVELGSRLDDVRDLGRTDDIYPFAYCAEREDELIDLIVSDIRF